MGLASLYESLEEMRQTAVASRDAFAREEADMARDAAIRHSAAIHKSHYARLVDLYDRFAEHFRTLEAELYQDGIHAAGIRGARSLQNLLSRHAYLNRVIDATGDLRAEALARLGVERDELADRCKRAEADVDLLADNLRATSADLEWHRAELQRLKQARDRLS